MMFVVNIYYKDIIQYSRKNFLEKQHPIIIVSHKIFKVNKTIKEQL